MQKNKNPAYMSKLNKYSKYIEDYIQRRVQNGETEANIRAELQKLTGGSLFNWFKPISINDEELVYNINRAIERFNFIMQACTPENQNNVNQDVDINSHISIFIKLINNE